MSPEKLPQRLSDVPGTDFGAHPNRTHDSGFFFRLFGLYGRQSHSLSSEDSPDGSQEGLYANWWEERFRLKTNRMERYRIFEEMDTFGMVMAILDVYAEEVTQLDQDKGKSVWIESKDTEVIKAGEECLRNCQVEDRVTSIVRRMCKYGDAFQRLIYQTNRGVLGWKIIPASGVSRLEDKYSRLIGFQQQNQQYRGDLKRKVSWPWDYVHFRLLGQYEEAGYGTSILENIFRPWRQLTLAEDSVLMYRIRRAPDRNLLMVDVGDMEEHEAMEFINLWRKRFRKFEFIDPASPEYKKQYNPLQPIEDIFLPTRGGEGSTRIESLSGAANSGDIYDLEYFRNKFFGAARVPKAYFGFEGEINAKCLCLSTPIPCLDGVVRSLGAIIAEYETTGKLPWVYSVDCQSGKIVAGEVEWAGVTRKNAVVVEVELDDGSLHVCTPDHRWYGIDGEEIEAKDLQPGQQLLPLRHGLVPVPNHAVRSVRVLSERRVTGDITVGVYHNFFIADAGSGGVLVHNSTLMQQDVRFARGAKKIRKAAIYGIRQLLDIHYTLYASTAEQVKKFDPAGDNKYLVQMTPISYLDEWERLELVQLRYQIVEAMAGLAQSMQIDPKVWAMYVLINFAKLPEDLVMKLSAKTGDVAEVTYLTQAQRAKILTEHGPEMLKKVTEPLGTEGFYPLNEDEKKMLCEAIHKSPALRKVIGDIAFYHEDDVDEAVLAQTEPGLLPPTHAGAIVEDDYVDDPAAKELREDVKELKEKKVKQDGREEVLVESSESETGGEEAVEEE